ncbi:MAG: hypothetical protein ACOVMQ_01880 [Cyclobacteriaceae bacterium]
MNSVQAYIAERTHSQAQIMSVLRSIILDVGPHVEEKISYKVPFFYSTGLYATSARNSMAYTLALCAVMSFPTNKDYWK